jgi:uncharacterized membrane protein YphA (DoxX/SURF4 family)
VSRSRELRSERVLAALRILMGGIFVAVWSDNLAKGLYGARGYAHFIRHYADTTPFHWYARLLSSVVIPHAAIFGRLQMVVELVVFGGFLLVGFLTPLAAVLAAGFFVAVLLGSWAIDWQGTYVTMIAILLAVAIGQAGRTWGVDALLARRNPRPGVPIY